MKPLKYIVTGIVAWAGCLAQETQILKVSAIEGNNVIVNTREGRAADIKILVTSPDNQPVEDASVTAVLPSFGPGGSFSGGETVRSITTGPDGVASFTGIHLRRVPGEIPIRIVARLGNQVGSTMLTQKASELNIPTVDRHRSKRRLAMYSILAGGAAAAVLAILMDGDQPPPAFNIAPGTPITNGPR